MLVVRDKTEVTHSLFAVEEALLTQTDGATLCITFLGTFELFGQTGPPILGAAVLGRKKLRVTIIFP